MTSKEEGDLEDQQQAEDEIVTGIVGIVPEPPSSLSSSSSPQEHHHHHHADAIDDNAMPQEGGCLSTESVENNTSSDNAKNNRDTASQPQLPSPYVLNPRWREYFFIGLFSLISLCFVADAVLPVDNTTNNNNNNVTADGNRGAGIAFGSVSFGIAVIVAIHEYIQYLISASQAEQQQQQAGNDDDDDDGDFHDAREFDYKLLFGGKLEGLVLAFLTLWWIIGVAYLTQVNGLAYAGSTNAYLSAWLSFAACLYTLFAWIKANHPTLISQSLLVPAWCILAFASWVVMCTSIEMFATEKESVIDHAETYHAEAVFGISVGLITFLLSLLWITLGHYYGQNDPTIPASSSKRSKLQWMELTLCIVCLIFWTMGVALLTRNGGLGGTVMGQTMPIVDANAFSLSNAADRTTTTTDPAVTVGNVVVDTTNVTNAAFSSAFYRIPGSNLYVSVWTCFAASIALVYQWILRQQQKQQQPQSPVPPPLSPPPPSPQLQRDPQLHDVEEATETTTPSRPLSGPEPEITIPHPPSPPRSVEEHHQQQYYQPRMPIVLEQQDEEEPRRPTAHLKPVITVRC